MKSTRREFMKQMGIALASLPATRCTRVTCYTPAVLPTPTPSAHQLAQQTATIRELAQQGTVTPETARRTETAIVRERLRACWEQLEPLAQQTAKDSQRGEATYKALVAEHRATLDDLIALEDIKATVADPVQAAFAAAAAHVWAINVPIICYKETQINYAPVTSDQLARQAALLAGMAQEGTLSPEAVARAQAAIERDIAFLSLPGGEVEALYARVLQSRGPSTPVPAFDEVELEISPEAARAAEFLVILLLKDRK